MPDWQTGGTFEEPVGNTRPVPPEMERVYAPVFPYRGIEQHGVPVENQPWLPVDGDEHSWDGEVPFDNDDIPVRPVPVIVVTDAEREIKSWRSVYFNLGKTTPALVVGQNEKMRRVTLKHAGLATDDGVIWISHDANMISGLAGYPLFARESISIATEEEVYAVADNAGTNVTVPLAILIETAV
jgi:hypothetical protein